VTIQANVQESKTRFSELLERVQRGEEVIIAKAGKPCARLVAIHSDGTRQAGAFRGRITGDLLKPVGSDDGSWI
jgi:prevent-host-death family protein